MKNDPLGLFSDEQELNDPLGLFEREDFVKQIPGNLGSVDPHISGYVDESTPLDVGRGIVEAGIATVTGIPAMLGEAYGQLGGMEPGKVASHFYQPRTEKGQEYTQAVGEFANRYLNPLMGGLGNVKIPPARRVPKTPQKGVDTGAILSELETPQKPNIPREMLPQDRAVLERLKGIDEVMSKTEGAEKGFQRKLRAEETPTVRGTEPLYVDPQQQVFRGDPREPNAVLALERQGEAMDVALDAPASMRPPGEPLELLQRKNMRAANEGVDASMQTIMDNQLREQLISRKVENHPMVRKAEERLTKQEELVIKLSEQVQQGKATASKLARAERDLDNLRVSLEKTLKNVDEATRVDRPATPFRFPKSQRGAINPEVFKEGFEQVKELANGVVLRAFSHDGSLTIEAKQGGKKLGGAIFERTYKNDPNNPDINAIMTGVVKEARGKGLASEVYSFASELGNDVVPSGMRTQEGAKMWKGFEQRGLSQGMRIPKKQRGAIDLGPGEEKAAKFLSTIPGIKQAGEWIPSKLTPESTIEAAKNLKDVDQNALQKLANLGTKGGLYQSLKTHNPVVRFAVENVLEADRLARGDIQQYVHDGLAPATRALSTAEKADIWAIVNAADMFQKEIDLDSLAAKGANEKQINYILKHRETMDKAFESINKAREMAGLKPVDKRVAYAAMRSGGDFRRLVYKLDENGEKVVVGIIGSDFRMRTNQLKAEMEAKGYTVGEERYFGGVAQQRSSAQQALMQTLEVLADKDPRVTEFLNTLDGLYKQEAYAFMNMKRHTLQKKGIFGMEGRKIWETAERNAKEGMQAQIDYAEAGLKWGRLSEAVQNIKQVLAAEEIDMPAAKQWSEAYMQNALGFNPSEVGHHLEQALAKAVGETGVGYSKVRETMSLARKTTNTMLLALDPGFWLTNVVQPMRAMPGMKAYLITKGLDAGFDFGTGWSYIARAGITDMKTRIGKGLSPIEKQAFDYAKKYHVYGSDLVEHSNRASKDVPYALDTYGNVVAGNIETGTRQMMYFAFVHMLDDNGLSVKNGLFEAAHNLTDMAMNNYSAVERPPMYNVMGPLGDMSANLASFKHNEISRLALFARQLKEEKSARPILAELGAGAAFAGITGTIAFAEADWLFREITKALGKPQSLSELVINMSEGIKDAPYLISHGMFSLLGVDMSKRLGLSDVAGNSAGDVLFPGGSKLADVASAAGTAVTNPTEMNAKRLAREAAPRPVAGYMDRKWFSKETPQGELALNRKTLEGQVIRDSADKAWKSFGFTGIHESVQKQKQYDVRWVKEAYADKRLKSLNHAREELFLTGKVSKETIQEYLNYEGDITTLMNDIKRMAMEQNIPESKRELLRASMSRSITQLKHAKRLKEAMNEE